MDSTSTTNGKKQATKAKKTGDAAFDRAFEYFSKTLEANIETQQGVMRMWMDLWPQAPGGNGNGGAGDSETLGSIQSRWSETLKEMLQQHRTVLEVQYYGAAKAMDAAIQMTRSTTPQEFREKAEQWCRTSLSAVQASSEVQLTEMQTAFKKWMETASRYQDANR